VDDFRYDQVWRRIRRDEYAKKLEGRFRARFDRLAHLVNWGSLAWIYPHASASKQEHHLGVEHNVMRFLDADDVRERHRPSLRTAAHVMHWGHPPLSYQGAEALLRAAHVSPEIEALLVSVVDEVVEFGSLDCASHDHRGRCVDALLAGERPFEVYRWLAAWLVNEDWSAVWEAIESSHHGDALDQDETKQALIRTLVCHDDRGFHVLSACNEADYIPRDLLQCGTAWLSVDPDVLWESDPIGRDKADEWSLIEAARGVLERRYYATPNSSLLHTLASRLIANSLVSSGLSSDSLKMWLEAPAGDAFYDTQLSSHYRAPYTHIKDTARHDLERDWWLIGAFEKVSLPEGNRFDAEDFISGRTGRNRLSYPFSEGFSVVAEIDGETPDSEFAGDERHYATVLCHQRVGGAEDRARPFLNALAVVDNWIGRERAHEVGNAIASRLLLAPATQQTNDLDDLVAEIAAENIDPIRGHLQGLRERTTYSEFNLHLDTAFTAELITDTDFGLTLAKAFLIRMPWRGYGFAAGKGLLGLLKREALSRASAPGKRSARGTALELAVACDQLLSPIECKHRFLILNATQWDGDHHSVREWDVLRVDLKSDGRWTIDAVECAIKRSKRKDEDSEARLGVLQQVLKGAFADFAGYRTWLATASDGDLSYVDGCRNYTP
jgi:hypothetical protein